MKNKLLSCIIAMLMLFASLLPAVTTKAKQIGSSKDINIEYEQKYEKEDVIDDLKYGIKDGEAYIIGYIDSLHKKVVIPEKIEECPVKHIAEYAFSGCSKLYEINTSNVEYIDRSAFDNCENLTTAQMPKVKVIERMAFSYSDDLEKVVMPKVEYIGRMAFFYCGSLQDVEMHDVKYISSDAFEETPYINSFTDEFVVVGDGVMIKYNGTKKDVMLPNEVKVVGGFYLNQTAVTVNTNNATIVSGGAFMGAEGLISIDMPNVITVTEGAFVSHEYPSLLKTVNMPKAETIGREAFSDCSSLENIDMPNVKVIEKEAFNGCNALYNVTIPQVKTIESDAFSYSALRSISMPNAEVVGDSAFCECLHLQKVEMQSLKSIGNNVFSNCLMLNEIVISADNQDFSAESGILYNKDKTKLYYYPAATDTVTLADSVKEIGNSAFCFDSKLKEINMPNVEVIDVDAFSNCVELQKVNMPNVKVINRFGFGVVKK